MGNGRGNGRGDFINDVGLQSNDTETQPRSDTPNIVSGESSQPAYNADVSPDVVISSDLQIEFTPVTQFNFRQQSDNNINLSVISTEILQSIVNVTFDNTPETLPTRAITVLDLPEVTIDKDKSGFIYNRFEKSERVSRVSPDAVLPNSSYASDQGTFRSLEDLENKERLKSRYTAPARYVKLSFTQDESVAAEFGASSFTTTPGNNKFKLLNPGGTQNSFISNINNIIKDINPSQILIEGGLSSFFYSGTELLDTGLDRKFYDFLKNSIKFSELYKENPVDSSLQDRLKNFIKASPEGYSESLMQEVLTNLGQRGYNSEGTKNQTSLDAAKTITHKLTFNNKFFDHIMRASLDTKTSVYEDEFRAYQNVSESISELTIQNSVPSSLSEDEFVTQIGSSFLYDFEILSDAVDFTDENNIPAIVHIGFLVEKIELVGSETNFLDPIVVGAASTSFVDIDVAYDATYVYKVRSLYAIEYDCISASDQIVRAAFVVASSPSQFRIKCVENVHPKPPQSVKFKYDHKQKGLMINWEFPPNPQGDVKGFTVFRRSSIKEPFTVIKEYDFDNSVIRKRRSETASASAYQRLSKDGETYVLTNCLDTEFNKKSEYIYAIGCFDAHNLVSNLSSQFRVKYNNKKRKVDIELAAGPNAPRAYPNLFLKGDIFIDAMKVSGKDRMTLYFDPEYYKLTETTGPENDPTENAIEFFTTTSDDNPTHKIQFVNVDLQRSNVLNIKIKDKSTPNNELGHPYLEPNNLSFSLKSE